MPTCVACDTDLLPGRPFCGGCGTPVAAAPPPAPVAATPACRCGAPLTGAFCGHCGAPRESAERPQPAPYAVPPPEPEPEPEPAGLHTPPEVGPRQLMYLRFGVEHGPVTAAQLGRIATAEGLPPMTQVRDTEGGGWFPLGELVRTSSPKSYGAALALAFFLGAMGAHWFYLGRPGLGLLRLVTWGGTMVLIFVAFEQATQTTYDVYTGYSGGLDMETLQGLWFATGMIALWSLLDLILVATKSVRDGDGRKLA